MKLTFIGAAQEVTGSCFLVETDGLRFLVDCGMFQGGREARARNLAAWPFEPRDIDFVLLTHAHIDHSGLLPRLCALGFRGPIITTTATVDLLSVMLLDSAFIQEGEWARAQRKRGQRPGRSRATAIAPLLYTVAQAEACLEQLQGVAYDDGSAAARVGALPLPRRRPHPRFGHPRDLGRAKRAAPASWCSRATSGSPAVRSCATRRRSTPPTCWWSNPPTATGCTAR